MIKIHIGKKIKEVLKKTDLTVTEFAKKISLTRDGANKIFKKDTIDSDQLLKISQVLNHDFHSYYSNNLSLVKENKNPYGFATKEEVESLSKLIHKVLHEFESLKNEIEKQNKVTEKKATYKKPRKKA